MIGLLAGAGLSAAAGLNAYIPFLLVALLGRFTDLITLPPSYDWIQSWPSIGVAAVLLGTEVVLDKIPIVDNINDLVATAIRPTVGGLIVAATSSAGQWDASPWMQQHPWVGGIGGALVALLVHTGKATVRPVVNVGTGGLGAPVVSAAEDGTALGLSLAAVFAPILVLIGLALLCWGFWWLLRRRRRISRRLAERLGTERRAAD